jgi:hypothetical protein
MDTPWLRIEVSADDDAPFIAMFEPSGMTYDLAGGERMTADVTHAAASEMQIVHWDGGISIWAPGPVVTRAADGSEIHHLN